MLLPLNEPLVFQTLKVKLIQSVITIVTSCSHTLLTHYVHAVKWCSSVERFAMEHQWKQTFDWLLVSWVLEHTVQVLNDLQMLDRNDLSSNKLHKYLSNPSWNQRGLLPSVTLYKTEQRYLRIATKQVRFKLTNDVCLQPCLPFDILLSSIWKIKLCLGLCASCSSSNLLQVGACFCRGIL